MKFQFNFFYLFIFLLSFSAGCDDIDIRPCRANCVDDKEVFTQYISGVVYRDCGDEKGVKQRLVFLEYNSTLAPFDSTFIDTDQEGKFAFSFVTSKLMSVPTYAYPPNLLIALDDSVHFAIPSKVREQDLELYLNDSIELIASFSFQSNISEPIRDMSLEFTLFSHSAYTIPSISVDGIIISDTLIHLPKMKLPVQNLNLDGSYRNEVELRYRQSVVSNFSYLEIPVSKVHCVNRVDSVAIIIP